MFLRFLIDLGQLLRLVSYPLWPIPARTAILTSALLGLKLARLEHNASFCSRMSVDVL